MKDAREVVTGRPAPGRTAVSLRVTDAYRVFASLVVARSEPHGFGGSLGQFDFSERRFLFRREPLLVLEHAIHPYLKTPLFEILHVGNDLEAAVRKNALLEAGAFDADLRRLVQQHKLARALDGVFRRIQLVFGGRIGRAAGKKPGNQCDARR